MREVATTVPIRTVKHAMLQSKYRHKHLAFYRPDIVDALPVAQPRQSMTFKLLQYELNELKQKLY